jgi:hypothetical protein
MISFIMSTTVMRLALYQSEHYRNPIFKLTVKWIKNFSTVRNKTFYINTFIYQSSTYGAAFECRTQTAYLSAGRLLLLLTMLSALSLSLSFTFIFYVRERDSSLTMISGRHVSATTPPRGLSLSLSPSRAFICLCTKDFFSPFFFFSSL